MRHGQGYKWRVQVCTWSKAGCIAVTFQELLLPFLRMVGPPLWE